VGFDVGSNGGTHITTDQEYQYTLGCGGYYFGKVKGYSRPSQPRDVDLICVCWQQISKKEGAERNRGGGKDVKAPELRSAFVFRALRAEGEIWHRGERGSKIMAKDNYI